MNFRNTIFKKKAFIDTEKYKANWKLVYYMMMWLRFGQVIGVKKRIAYLEKQENSAVADADDATTLFIYFLLRWEMQFCSHICASSQCSRYVVLFFKYRTMPQKKEKIENAHNNTNNQITIIRLRFIRHLYLIK